MKNLMIKALVIGAMLLCVAPFSFARAAIFEPGFEVETVTGGLTLPTAMAFAPDGRIFIAEKGGAVRVIKDGALLATPVITLTDINTFGDRGLIGMALDPNFASNQYLYLAYTYENTPGEDFSGEKTGRIVRLTVDGDIASESSKVVILGTVGGNALTPSCDDYPVGTDCIPSDSMSHSVGGLRFGPDGYLYASLGDGANFDVADPRSLRAQDLGNLAGKVVRINTDGTAPDTNPFYDGDPNSITSKVYAYGVRNGFRFNFQPITGRLFLGDVGWSHWEEINRITPGANYGWPCYEGTDTTDHNCLASGTTNPTYTYEHDTNGAGSVTAGSFPTSGAYPEEYDNSFFFGDYAQNWIKRLVFDANNNVTSVHDFMDDPDGPVDIATGPDGNIYYLSIYTGELHRLTHTTGNRRPVAELTADVTSGLAPLPVSFTSTGSADPDGDPLTYYWDFGDGTTSDLVNPTHEYTIDGVYIAALTVTDDQGSAVATSTTITVGNQQPVPEITSPLSGSFYSPNGTIELLGTATDPEDGVLDASQLHWQIILHHNTHIHILQEFDGVTNPSFIAPEHDSVDVYVEVVLSATDSGGLIGSHSVNLYQVEAPAGGNLISNPSLEVEDDAIPGTPDKWIKGGYGVNDAVFSYPVAGFEGESAAKVEIANYTDGDAKWYFDPVFVSPGSTYVFSHEYLATVDTQLYAQLGFSNGTYAYQLLDTLLAVSEATHQTLEITVPDDVQTLTIFQSLEQVGSLTIDNYSLTLAADVVPDTEAPTVSIASPIADTILSGTQTIIVTAADNIGVEHVSLLIDGVQVGEESHTAPYEFVLDTTTLADGAYTLSALAHDAAENATVSELVNITIANQASVANLIYNADLEIASADPQVPDNWIQSSWGNNTVVFSYPVTGYNGASAARLEITSYPVDGTGDAKWFFNPISVIEGAEYTYTDYYRSNTISDIIGRYTLDDGTYHYFGLAKEIQPSETWQSITATFVPPVDATHVTFFHLISAVGYLEIDDVELHISGTGTPAETNVPVVTFTNPLEGQSVSGSVTITADSTDDTAVTYIFYAVDGIPVTGQITEAPYAFVWDTTTVANGSHTLKATTHDPYGNNSTDTIVVTVDNTASPPPPSSEVANNSLEMVDVSGDPEYWFRGGWGTNTRTYTYPVSGPDSASAARIDVTSYTDGDAKWFFEDVVVTPGALYTFTHAYRANVESNLTVRYAKADGLFQYVGIKNVAAAEGWTEITETISVPADAVSMTIFHSLMSVGWLEVDDYLLSTGSDDTFAQGMVSLTFDDGWLSHYTAAMPILDAAGVKGTFYIVSQETANALAGEEVANPSLEVVGADGDPEGWLRGGWGANTTTYSYPVAGIDGVQAASVEIISYTDGDAKWYFEDVAVIPGAQYDIANSYNSTAATEIIVRYTLTDGSVQYAFLEALPATSGSWVEFSETISAPENAVSLTVFHVIAQVGLLTVDKYSVKQVPAFVDIDQMLALQASGHEIGGHSQTHADLTTLTLAEAEEEIVGSRTELLNMGASPVNAFAYPYGAYTPDVQAIVQAGGYTSARGVERGFNVKTTDKFALKVQQINRTTTLSEVQAWTEQALADKTWLILMFHQIDYNEASTIGSTPESLQDIVDYLVTTTADIVTVEEGLAFMNLE